VRSAVDEYALLETVESYKARCLDRSAQLWLIADQDQVVGCGITEIYGTPKGITEADGYRIHTFTSSGDFEITSGEGDVEYLIVGGGGGGGGSTSANAGGAGGSGVVIIRYLLPN
jgi:hypothetical protein